MKINNIKRDIFKFSILLFVVIIVFILGFQMGKLRERAGNIAVFRLAIPIDEALSLSQGEFDRVSNMKEVYIDRAIFAAVLLRTNNLLLPSDKKNLDKALKRAFSYRSEVDYHYKIEDFRPSLQKKLSAARADLMSSEE